MRSLILLALLLPLMQTSFSQTHKTLILSGHFGLGGNFFVRGYDEVTGPQSHIYFYKKNFLGTMSGVDLSMGLSTRDRVGLAYTRSINKGKANYYGTINNVDVIIDNFTTRHCNNLYQAYYERKIFRMAGWSVQAGLVMVYPQQQELSIEPGAPAVFIEERNYSKNNLVDAGFTAGIRYETLIDKHFFLGCQAKIFYIASANYFECISLTPTLAYRF